MTKSFARLCVACAAAMAACCIAASAEAQETGATTQVSASSRPAGAPSHPLKTWAVLAAKELQDSGLADQVTSLIAQEKGVTLVDREQLRAVMKELSIGHMQQALGADQRLKVGRVLQADALILLSRSAVKDKQYVSLIICDCHGGTRLRVECFPFDSDKVKAVASDILACALGVRKQYESGVQYVFGVPPFVSRTLAHEYDYLQVGFSNLLARALANQKGVAVIEVEEARQIAREISLAGGKDIERVVPSFITGEFEAAKDSAPNEPGLTFRVKVSGPGDEQRTLPPRKVALSKAAAYVGVELPALVAGANGPGALDALTPERQATALVARADVFASLGGWEHSTGLREAALLLKDDPAQREKLLQEYCWLVEANWPGKISDIDAFETEHRQRARLWRTALDHLEYEIRNRQTTLPQAVTDTERVLHCAYRLINASSEPIIKEVLPRMEEDKRRFLREVFPLALKLDHVSKYESGRQANWADWANRLFDYGTVDYRRGNNIRDDLDFVVVLLTKVMPDDLDPQSKIVYFLSGMSEAVEQSKNLISKEEYLAFLDKLMQSGRPACRFLARFARLKCTRPVPMEDIDNLNRDYHEAAPRLRGYRGSVLGQMIQDMAVRAHMTPESPTGKVAPPSYPKDPVVAEGVELTVKELSGKKVPFRSKMWRTSHGLNTMDTVIGCGRGIDVFWQNGAIAVMREKGLLEEILVDPKATFWDVKWDGRNLWVATPNGLMVVSLEGKVLARIGHDDNLPPADRGCRLCPISEGKVLAAGALGPHQRLWLAIVEHDGKQVKVNVFHEGTRVLAAGEQWSTLKPDVNWAGEPHWVRELCPAKKDSPRTVLVGWGFHRRALQVDLSTLKVSLYPTEFHFANMASDKSCFVRNGEFFQTILGSQFLIDGNDVFEVGGGVWRRLNLATGWAVEIGRMRSGPELFLFGNSAHYGIVGWTGKGEFFQLTVVRKSPPTAEESAHATMLKPK